MTKKMYLSAAVLALLFSGSDQSLAGAQGSEARCNGILADIQRYSNLKRAGGNSAQMARWHKKRNQLKDKYRNLNCRTYE